VTVQPDLTAKYPAAWPTRIEIELADGSVIRGAADFPRGNPENPVATEELEQKFVDLVAPRFGADVAHRGIRLARSLEQAGDMATHFRDLLVAAEAPAHAMS
jgi:2-methylcitrate dehydratase PrpD